MKRALFSTTAFCLLALAAILFWTPAVAAENSSPTASSKSPFQLLPVFAMSPELDRAERELIKNKDLNKRGLLSNDEIALQATVVANLRREMKPTFILKSSGGSLSELLGVLTGDGGGSEPTLTVVNVGEPADLEARLPAFTLNRVDWGTIIEVLSKLLASQGLDLTYAGSDTKSAVCVLRRIAPSAPAVASNPSRFEAFGLSDYIYREQTIDVIVDAIRTAWALDPERARNPAALQLKFHPGTKILLVSGPSPADAIARQVIASLAKKPEKIF